MSTADSRPGDTTAATVVRGSRGLGGWCALVTGPGEQREHTVPSGEVLGCLWHLSDLHVCDAESPARLEYLDRHSDPDSPFREDLGDIGTYRPQEILTVQVATMMVRTVNAMPNGPTSGAPIAAVVITGDVTDNAQRNELSWYQGLLEGGTVSPRSGSESVSSWVGARGDVAWDERYWHPDGPPDGEQPDLPMRRFGYPAIPGLVEAARRDVHSPGLAIPWMTVHGNHDGLLQGTVPPDADLRALAVGSERITDLPPGIGPLVTKLAIGEHGPVRYVHEPTSPRVSIPGDPDRGFVGPDEFARVTRPRAAGTGPLSKYYAEDVGALRLIALDTVNPHGGWQGSLDGDQLAWLVEELGMAADRHVVIASHHPSPTLTNSYAPEGAAPRVLGPQVVDALLAAGNVVAWIAGHVHFHAAGRHGDDDHGFWELTTASLIDWPQQGRILEFLRVSDRGRPEIAIVSTVVDHAAAADWSSTNLDDPANLAAISRTLAANDYRLRENSRRGVRLESAREVRNVVWRSPDPLA
jgi:metallophosphoesterase (TIGR03767 family)